MATARTDEIIRRADAQTLARSITVMADRYAESDRDAVYAYVEHSRSYIAGDTAAADKAKAEHERNLRAAMRRRDALARLTKALCLVAECRQRGLTVPDLLQEEDEQREHDA